MDNRVVVTEKDELIMSIVHYFVTKENYAPIMVNGVKNEVWLENLEAEYKIIRINSNYIHNDEQLEFDRYKLLNVNKQISKKTLTMRLKTLNIYTDVNENVKMNNSKEIDNFIIQTKKDLINKNGIISLFPQITDEKISGLHGLDFLLNVSNDINKKTEKENKFYEKVFSEKKIIITKILIGINIFIYILSLILFIFGKTNLYNILCLNGNAVKNGEWYRLITSPFIHQNIIHFVCNMSSLYIIGIQLESFIGKKKYTIVYFISAIIGGLLSCVLSTYSSLGASGAIFGLLGALLYFGYHYRIYLGTVLRQQIIPLIIFNLFLSFIIQNINIYTHIGGLIGGFLIMIAAGVENKTKKSERINGLISLIILIIFLVILIIK